MPTFDEYATALRARDQIRDMIREEVERTRQPYRIVTIVSWDVNLRTALVQYPEGGDPQEVALGSATPSYVGQNVRVVGPAGDKYIEDLYVPELITVRQRLWTSSYVAGVFNNSNGPANTWAEVSAAMRYNLVVTDPAALYVVKVECAIISGAVNTRTFMGVWDGVVGTGTDLGCSAITDLASYHSVSAEKVVSFSVGTHNLRVGERHSTVGGAIYGDPTNYPCQFEVFQERQVIVSGT